MDALKELVGTWHNLYGVDNNFFKLGKKVYEANEDESDGYRSYLGSIKLSDKKSLIFFKQPIAKVKIVEVNGNPFDGYHFVDSSGHIWLEIGTDGNDDYYPWFVFKWNPKEHTKHKVCSTCKGTGRGYNESK